MLHVPLYVLHPRDDRGRNQLRGTTFNGLFQPTVGHEFCGGFCFFCGAIR